MLSLTQLQIVKEMVDRDIMRVKLGVSASTRDMYELIALRDDIAAQIHLLSFTQKEGGLMRIG